MKYSYPDNIRLSVEPQEFNRNSSKEILQYAVGGLLYMPATKNIADIILNKTHPEYKSICLDLEDAIGDDTVTQAEECLKSNLTRIKDAVDKNVISINDVPLIFIRVRTPDHFKHIIDVCGTELFSIITGFNFPKFDKTNCDAYIKAFMNMQSKCKTELYFMPIIESKNVMYSQRRMDQLLYLQNKLSEVSDHVLNIRVGATDFCNLFGIRRSIRDSIYDQKVIADCFADVINIFARNYVCSGPVWEYFDSNGTPGLWSEGLKNELRLDKLNGFFGKTCIHPQQLPIIAESNIVSYENYQDAINILGMSDGLIGVQKGYKDNKMNEVKTHTNWAKKIVGRAVIYGVFEEEKETSII